jgi:hypothetical protein
VTKAVVDDLQPININKQHCGLQPIAVDPRDQPLKLSHEATPIGQVDERILVSELVELRHALLQARDLCSQLADLLDQPITIVDVHDVSQLVRHCP